MFAVAATDSKALELSTRLAVTKLLKWWLLCFGVAIEELAPLRLCPEFGDQLSAAMQRYR